MVKRTGPTNPYLRKLIENIRQKYIELKAPIWRSVIEKLEKPRRQKVVVNLSKIERYAKDGETVLVPGKVLSSGNLTKKVRVAAWQFSKQAEEKIRKSGGEVISIEELIEENPKGSNVKILV